MSDWMITAEPDSLRACFAYVPGERVKAHTKGEARAHFCGRLGLDRLPVGTVVQRICPQCDRAGCCGKGKGVCDGK